MTVAMKGIAKLKKKLQRSRDDLAKERTVTERAPKDKAKGSPNDEVGSKRL